MSHCLPLKELGQHPYLDHSKQKCRPTFSFLPDNRHTSQNWSPPCCNTRSESWSAPRLSRSSTESKVYKTLDLPVRDRRRPCRQSFPVVNQIKIDRLHAKIYNIERDILNQEICINRQERRKEAWLSLSGDKKLSDFASSFHIR